MINVEEHTGLVGLAVKQMYPKYKDKIEYEDMFQIGMIGLIDAARKFDKNRNCKFSTLAIQCIKYSILNSFRSSGCAICNKHERHKISNVVHITEESENIVLKDDEDDLIDSILIRQAIAMLSQEERKIITLKYFKGYSQKEIGQKLGVTQVAVSRREIKAIEKMRAYIKETTEAPSKVARVAL